MRPVNEKLAADLLEAGKQEFLEKGFQGASMRGIASRLSVTTGALYRYYTDKESLFDVLVEEPARVLREIPGDPEKLCRSAGEGPGADTSGGV